MGVTILSIISFILFELAARRDIKSTDKNDNNKNKVIT